MGVLEYANVDVQALQDNDNFIAQQYDARQAEIQRVVARAQAAE